MSKKAMNSSRLLAGVVFLAGLSWLLPWWHIHFRLGQVLTIVPFALMMGLHLIAALGGFRATTGGMLLMLLFTALAVTAPPFLAVPFQLGIGVYAFYLTLICSQLLLLILCFSRRGTKGAKAQVVYVQPADS